ncbi:MAG TPA: VOC family protein [Longimicrobium sp.]|jgi:catechol 2,3-dioxygenase
MDKQPAAGGPGDWMTLGPVHLDVVDGDRSLGFWQGVVGLHPRGRGDDGIELGTADETLLVLHPGATSGVRRGFSGLYHVALHLPDEPEFARVLARLIARRYPVAPTDHVMSKALYLDDPDGIGLELALETPERVRSTQFSDTGAVIIDSDGRMRGPTEPLDVERVLAHLPDRDVERPVPPGTTVGHIHLHVGDLEAARRFYGEGLGFHPRVYLPKMRIADFDAGGRFPHRLAVNVWQGEGAPQPPAGTAGLRHFAIRFDDHARMEEALRRVPGARHDAGGAWLADPAGNQILLTA